MGVVALGDKKEHLHFSREETEARGVGWGPASRGHTADPQRVLCTGNFQVNITSLKQKQKTKKVVLCTVSEVTDGWTDRVLGDVRDGGDGSPLLWTIATTLNKDDHCLWSRVLQSTYTSSDGKQVRMGSGFVRMGALVANGRSGFSLLSSSGPQGFFCWLRFSFRPH